MPKRALRPCRVSIPQPKAMDSEGRNRRLNRILGELRGTFTIPFFTSSSVVDRRYIRSLILSIATVHYVSLKLQASRVRHPGPRPKRLQLQMYPVSQVPKLHICASDSLLVAPTRYRLLLFHAASKIIKSSIAINTSVDCPFSTQNRTSSGLRSVYSGILQSNIVIAVAVTCFLAPAHGGCDCTRTDASCARP